MALSLEARLGWRTVLEGMAAAVAGALRGHTGTEHGRARLRIGAGGDRTAVVDEIAEGAIVAACEWLAAAGTRFSLRSEELGDRDFGAAFPLLLVDPVDGSLNAMHGIPYYCVALAVLDGETLGDVAAGVVRNLAGPGLYSAVRGAGALLDGRPLHRLEVALDADRRIPMLLLEAYRSLGRRGSVDLGDLFRRSARVRLLGSSALSLCQVGSGAASALVAPEGMRPWDCVAGLCLLRECAAVVTDLDGAPLDDHPAGIGERSPIVASLSPEVHARVLELLSGG